MSEPTHGSLRRDLWAQVRYARLVKLLGEPKTGKEIDLFILLARLLSDAETELLTELVTRRGGAA